MELTPGDTSDAALVAGAQRGDEQHFSVLMRRHHAGVRRVVRRVIHDESAAQDVVQDTWVRGFTHLRELSAGAAFSTWIRRIAFHEAALATLPALFREVFWLRSVEGCSVAEALRVPEQTVKTRHFRARGALQERLASWFDQTDETPSIRVAVFG